MRQIKLYHFAFNTANNPGITTVVASNPTEATKLLTDALLPHLKESVALVGTTKLDQPTVIGVQSPQGHRFIWENQEKEELKQKQEENIKNVQFQADLAKKMVEHTEEDDAIKEEAKKVIDESAKIKITAIESIDG